MILGIGVDIVHVDRMRHWGEVDGLFERFFNPQELETARKRGHAATLALAARFAAKEAFGKAVGSGLRGIRLQDIQVINRHNGKPDIELFGTAKKAFDSIGGKRLFLSLTHEHDNAVAMVVIEGDE